MVPKRDAFIMQFFSQLQMDVIDFAHYKKLNYDLCTRLCKITSA